jgi:hypothetical protein
MSLLSLSCLLLSFCVSLEQAHEQGVIIPREGVRMSSVTLYRASGLALLLGAVLFIVGSILSFAGAPLTPIWLVATGVYISGMVLTLLGLPGIVARQAPRAGWLLIAAAVVDLGSFVIGSLGSLSLTSVAVGLLSLGLGWMGYALLTAKGEAEAVPHPVPAS